MPKSQIGIATIPNRSDLRWQSTSEIAIKIASQSVEKRVKNCNWNRSDSNRCDLKALAGWIWNPWRFGCASQDLRENFWKIFYSPPDLSAAQTLKSPHSCHSKGFHRYFEMFLLLATTASGDLEMGGPPILVALKASKDILGYFFSLQRQHLAARFRTHWKKTCCHPNRIHPEYFAVTKTVTVVQIQCTRINRATV